MKLINNKNYRVLDTNLIIDLNIIKYLNQIGLIEGEIITIVDNQKRKYILTIDKIKYAISKNIIDKIKLEIEN